MNSVIERNGDVEPAYTGVNAPIYSHRRVEAGIPVEAQPHNLRLDGPVSYTHSGGEVPATGELADREDRVAAARVAVSDAYEDPIYGIPADKDFRARRANAINSLSQR